MSCVLRAAGREFDVGAFLADSPLHPEGVYQGGEPVPASSPGRQATLASGFNLAVSEAGFDDLPGQVRDAIEFLDQHEDELRRLGRFPGVEDVSLDFGVLRKDVASQTDTFPADFLWRAGALDITLRVTHYLVVTRES